MKCCCLYTARLVIAVPVYHEVGDGTGPEGVRVPAARRSKWDPRYLMSGASRREVRREQTHSARLSHIERVFVCARCTVRNRMSFEATERGCIWKVSLFQRAAGGLEDRFSG